MLYVFVNAIEKPYEGRENISIAGYICHNTTHMSPFSRHKACKSEYQHFNSPVVLHLCQTLTLALRKDK